jgi:nucleoside permease NupC
MNPLLYSCSQTLINMTILQNSLCLVSVSVCFSPSPMALKRSYSLLARMPVCLPECFLVSPIYHPTPLFSKQNRKKKEITSTPHQPNPNQHFCNQKTSFLSRCMYVARAPTVFVMPFHHISRVSPPSPSVSQTVCSKLVFEKCIKYEILNGYVCLGISLKYVCMRYFHTQLPILAQKTTRPTNLQILLDMLRNLRFHVESSGT